MMLTR